MPYLHDMKRLLRLDQTIYADLAARQLALRYTVVNVLLLGLIYGVATLHFSHQLAARQGAVEIHFNAPLILMVGVSVAFLMHGAAALFIWVFCRALGGCPHFMTPYLNLGVAAIALWPLAPLVALLQVAPPGILIQAVGLAAAAYGLAVGYVAVAAASGLSRGKMIFCALATVFYVGCFLYLWT